MKDIAERLRTESPSYVLIGDAAVEIECVEFAEQDDLEATCTTSIGETFRHTERLVEHVWLGVSDGHAHLVGLVELPGDGVQHVGDHAESSEIGGGISTGNFDGMLGRAACLQGDGLLRTDGDRRKPATAGVGDFKLQPITCAMTANDNICAGTVGDGDHGHDRFTREKLVFQQREVGDVLCMHGA